MCSSSAVGVRGVCFFWCSVRFVRRWCFVGVLRALSAGRLGPRHPAVVWGRPGRVGGRGSAGPLAGVGCGPVARAWCAGFVVRGLVVGGCAAPGRRSSGRLAAVFVARFSWLLCGCPRFAWLALGFAGGSLGGGLCLLLFLPPVSLALLLSPPGVLALVLVLRPVSVLVWPLGSGGCGGRAGRRLALWQRLCRGGRGLRRGQLVVVRVRRRRACRGSRRRSASASGRLAVRSRAQTRG